MKKERNIIVLVFASIIILISIFLVSASNPFEDIFSNFETGIIGFIISLVPAIILMIITYISLKKAKVGLMIFQVLLWWIFTIYVCLRAFAFSNYYFNLGFMPQVAIDFFTTNNVPTDPNSHYWYVLSIYINAGIGLVMSLGNGVIRKIFIRAK